MRDPLGEHATKRRGRPRLNVGTCLQPNCNRPTKSVGMCRRHYEQMLRNEAVAKGICGECKRLPIGDGLKTLCLVCAAKIRASVRLSLRKRRKNLLNLNLCVDCGLFPVEPNRTLCSMCLDDRCRREKKRRQRLAERI
jgi:hypothetical protein